MSAWRTVVCVGIVMALTALSGCKPTVPSTFLSEDEMEDILYDYHLAEAMARVQGGDYSHTLVTYRTAVLRKYGVSQEKFDTSMVYYMRHTEQLLAIYKHISERMESRAHELGSNVGSLAEMGNIRAHGDTTDIWKGESSVALIPDQPYNLRSFTLRADSSFRQGDSFTLTLTSNFIFQDGSRDGVVSLAVVYANDSVASRVQHVSSAMPVTVSISNDDSLKVREVRGFFLLAPNTQTGSTSTTLHLMTLSHIHLYRIRAQRRVAPPSPSSSGPAAPGGDSLRRQGVAPSATDTSGRRPGGQAARRFGRVS